VRSDAEIREELVKQLTRRELLARAGAGAAVFAMGGAIALPELAGAIPLAKRGGTLRVGLSDGSSKDHVNPYNAQTQADMCRVAQIYETLLEFSPTYKARPLLAESVTGSSGARVWTIRLRRGIAFHNGKSLTAQDLAYTFQYVLDPQSPAPVAGKLVGLTRDNVKVLDARTVQLTFPRPLSIVPQIFAEAGSNALRVVPNGWTLPTEFTAANTVGTGPFKFQSLTPGQNSVFVRNDNYWRTDRPYLDRVDMIDLSDATALVNALISGQIDTAAHVPASLARLVSGHNNLALIESPTGAWPAIYMQMNLKPFTDVRVRQAFRLFPDRPQMIKNVLSGHGTIGNDLYGRFDPDYAKDLPQRHQDIEQAKFLLKKAGQSDLRMEFIQNQFDSSNSGSAQAFVKYAKQAGVRLKIRPVDNATFLSKYYLKTPLSQDFWGNRGYLLQALNWLPGAPYNTTHWRNKRWNKLVLQALQTVDPKKRHELMHEAQKIEWTSGTYVVWGFPNVLDAHNKNVHGLVRDVSGWSFNTFRLRDVWLG
jgi:peptide/nickel transport system substrate-binding protein